jgi:hypothetical protein
LRNDAIFFIAISFTLKAISGFTSASETLVYADALIMKS